MRIGIDARFYGAGSKGLGRYTQKLIEKLEKISEEGNEFFIFLKKENWDEYQPKNPKFTKVLANFHWYSWSEQWHMPKLLKRYNLDLVHFPHFNVPILYQRPFVVTIHDLILLHYPTIKGTTLTPIFYWFKFLVYKIVIYLAIKKSQHVIAVSKFTKKDILQNYNIANEKISVTYEAADNFPETSSNQTKNILEKYGIMKPYLLYVGNAYPHKNLEKLIASFQDVLREKPDLFLVLVGKKDYFYQQLENKVKINSFQKIIFTGYIPDEEMDVVYKNSTLYIFPSLYEGFGLPPLEAMLENVPILSSDHECLKEILGGAAIFFDASKKNEISQSIINLINDDFKKNNLVNIGATLVKKYSWEKMAKETLQIYENKNVSRK